MAKTVFLELETFANERRPKDSRLAVVAERLAYAVEYLSADDLRNWTAADVRVCSEVTPQDLSEMEAVISAAFMPVSRRAPQSVGMRGLTIRQ